jgi:site-specific recombinase XerC
METLLEKAHKIEMPFLAYTKELGIAQQSQKKTVETAQAFLRWAKLYHEKQFIGLPSYWLEDITPPQLEKKCVDKFVSVAEVAKITSQKIGKSNLALWRDQAMACMLFISGARASAAATLPIKAVHLNDDHPCIEQKPELGVRTKNGKAATTYLHKIPDLLDFVRGWDEFVRANFPEDHLWYSPIHQTWGKQSKKTLVPGKNHHHALGKRLRIISAMNRLPYKSPHQYRHGYALYGLGRCQTMEQYHALCRNMMQNNISITDRVYVHLDVQERGRILSGIYANPVMQPDGELAAFILKLGKEDIQDAHTLIANRLVSL